MSIWIASYILLWLITLFLLFALISLYRHVGLIHMRFGPRGALDLADEGPATGERIAEPVLTDTTGTRHVLTDGASQRILIYVSATCDTCVQLIPAIRTLSRHSAAHVIVLSLDSTTSYESALPGLPMVSAGALARAHRIRNTPYAIAVDEHGIVAGKGIVNNLEHLEDMERALERPTKEATLNHSAAAPQIPT
jgi:methylamine dehydrogenase accessory protein MauD